MASDSGLNSALSRRSFLAGAGKGTFGLLVATGSAGLLAACGSSGRQGTATSGSGSSPVAGGTLTAAITGDPTSMDPTVADVYPGSEVYDNIFSKLIVIGSDGSYLPSLATSWSQASPTEWTLDLVSNATFHNGEPFSADDVKYTFDRILAKATASPFLPDYSEIAAVEVVSPTRVTFHLSSPFGPFLTNLATNAQIVNQKAIEAGDSKLKPVGTGPFQFVEWVQNEKVTVKRFPKYFKSKQPYLDGISFEFLPNDHSRIEALESGSLDWADAVPLQELPSVEKGGALRYVTSAAAGNPDFLAFNCSKAPFNNTALRQAIAYAIDTKQIVELAYFGVGAKPGSEEVGPGSKWYGGQSPYQSGPNLTLARQKLQQAGYPRGLTVEYLGISDFPNLLATGEAIQAQLKKIGVNMKITQMPATTWITQFASGNYQLSSAYWAGTVDPDNFYSNILASGAGNNFPRYSNTQLDNLIKQARTTTDFAERKSLYAKLRALVWEEVPLYFTAYETTTYVMSKNVNGSTITPSLDLNLGQVWKK